MSEEKRFPISVYLTDIQHQEFLKLLLDEVLRLRNEVNIRMNERDNYKTKLKELGIDFDDDDWWRKMSDVKQKLGIKDA
jgi:hypothetical protein